MKVIGKIMSKKEKEFIILMMVIERLLIILLVRKKDNLFCLLKIEKLKLNFTNLE